MSRWLLDFVDGDDEGLAGFVRLELRDDEPIAWYWTYLVGVPGVDGVLVVRDHEVLPPSQRLEIRADGLWAELVRETAREHWTFGLESFGVRLDTPEEALRTRAEIGDRIAVGLDVEWEVGAAGPPAGTVHGDVLVGRARHEIDGPGWFYDDDEEDPAWIEGETLATVFIPVVGTHIERRLVRTRAGRRWSLDRRRNAR